MIIKAFITWRKNSAVHYVNVHGYKSEACSNTALCGAELPYSEVWDTNSDITCPKCKRWKKEDDKKKVKEKKK